MAINRDKERRQRLFIAAYAEGATVREAAERAGLMPHSVYSHWYKDPEFVALMEEAERVAIERAEATIRRLAIVGERKVKFSAKTGEPYQILNPNTKEKEDYAEYDINVTCLLRWLESRKPETWSPRLKLKPEDLSDADLLRAIAAGRERTARAHADAAPPSGE